MVKSEIPDMHVDTILESRDATFFENTFPMKDMHSIARISSEIFALVLKIGMPLMNATSLGT